MMLFVLHPSLIDVDFTKSKNIDGLVQLLYSVAQGRHVLFGDTSVLEKLLILDRLTDTLVSVVRKTICDRPTVGALRKAINRFVYVVESDRVLLNETDSWSITLDFLAENGAPRSALLCEGEVDTKLYSICAKHYATHMKFTPTISLSLQSGGGASISAVYERELNCREKFVLCITDSDKDYPDAEICQVSKECGEVGMIKGWPTRHFCLYVRELENVIPFNLIEAAVCDGGCRSTKERLAALFDAFKNDKGRLEFVDMKNGISVSTALKLDWWGEAFRCRSSYRRAERCKKIFECDPGERDCSCVFVPMIAEKISEMVLGFCEKNSMHKTLKIAATSFNFHRWLEVGAVAYEWGLAAEKIRS